MRFLPSLFDFADNEKDNINDLLGVAPVWMSDIFNLEDALKMIESVSEITGKVAEGKHLNEEIRAQFQMLTNKWHPNATTR